MRQRVSEVAAAAFELGYGGKRDGQSWLEVDMQKTPRPDQVKPLQLRVRCPELRVRLQPMHVTLLMRMQGLYFTFSGVAWERVQQYYDQGFGFEATNAEPVSSQHVGCEVGTAWQTTRHSLTLSSTIPLQPVQGTPIR